MTPQQLATLKAHILASTDPDVVAARAIRNDTELARLYNLNAAPDFYVWRSTISRNELYYDTSPDGTDWDFTIYKGQTVPEQGAWREMFMGDELRIASPKVRVAVGKIFGASNAQTIHVLAAGKRLARLVEKIFADTSGGSGAKATPATLTFEGEVNIADIGSAMNLP